MSIKTSNEKICINKIMAQKQEKFIIEEDEIVPDIKPDVLKVASSNGSVCIYKKEVQEGRIKIEGSINIYTLYIADDETASMRCINSELNFTKIIEVENASPNMELEQFISIQSIDAKILNGRKINFKVSLCLDLNLYLNECIDILKSVEDIKGIQTLNRSYQIYSMIGCGTTTVYVKDTMKIDKVDDLLEIIDVNTSIINKENKISYNKVLTKSDLLVKILYLTNDNRVSTASLSVPVMGFIDIQGIKENNICDEFYQIKSLNIRPNNVEDHSVSIEAEIEVKCCAYEKKEIQTIEDLYSPFKELDFKENDIRVLEDEQIIKSTWNFRKQELIKEIGNNKIYDVRSNPVILNKKIINGKISYEGEMNLTFFFSTEKDGSGVNCKTIIEPFEFSIDNNQINSNSKINTEINIISQDFIVMPDERIDARIDMEFNVSIQNTDDIKILSDINETDAKERKTYSLVIYYTKPGDTLWSIAKKFGSTIEDIAKVNELDDEKNIFVGEQLFIPR